MGMKFETTGSLFFIEKDGTAKKLADGQFEFPSMTITDSDVTPADENRQIKHLAKDPMEFTCTCSFKIPWWKKLLFKITWWRPLRKLFWKPVLPISTNVREEDNG